MNLKLNLKLNLNCIINNEIPRYERDRSKVLSKITDYIYLSDYSIASNISLLEKTGITHLINCAAEHHDIQYDNIKTLKLDLVDTPNQPIEESFKCVIQFIDNARKENGYSKILVFCHKGISRSASLVILYIMHTLKCPMSTAYSIVQNARSIVNPNFGFYQSLKQYSIINGFELPNNNNNNVKNNLNNNNNNVNNNNDNFNNNINNNNIYIDNNNILNNNNIFLNNNSNNNDNNNINETNNLNFNNNNNTIKIITNNIFTII